MNTGIRREVQRAPRAASSVLLLSLGTGSWLPVRDVLVR